MFSQTTEYALRAMAWLALSPNQLVPTVTLAERTRVPSHYLAKVLQQLSAGDLIKGRRGVGGGYRLSRPPAEITLKDVVQAVTPIERITTCPLGLANHGPNLCPLHTILDKLAVTALDMLESKTLQDLINDPGRNKPLCDAETTARLTVSARTSTAL